MRQRDDSNKRAERVQRRLRSGRVAAGLVCVLTLSCQHPSPATSTLGPDLARHGGPAPASPSDPGPVLPAAAPPEPASAAPTLRAHVPTARAPKAVVPTMPVVPPRPPSRPPGYAPPTVTATRFVSCRPSGHGNDYNFSAEIDLHGGMGWSPMMMNLTRKSGDTWQWSENAMRSTPDNQPSSPEPLQQVVWGWIFLYDLYDDGSSPQKQDFPAAMVIRENCPQ